MAVILKWQIKLSISQKNQSIKHNNPQRTHRPAISFFMQYVEKKYTMEKRSLHSGNKIFFCLEKTSNSFEYFFVCGFFIIYHVNGRMLYFFVF
jgi:hypothetical protein